MQSTGHSSTHARSSTSIHGSPIVSVDHLDVKVPDVPRSRYADAEPFTVTAHFGIMYRIG
jgi:hypothetical protein